MMSIAGQNQPLSLLCTAVLAFPALSLGCPTSLGDAGVSVDSGVDGGPKIDEDALEQELCRLMTDFSAPYQAVLAGETVESAPDVSQPGVRYGIGLVEGDDGVATGSVIYRNEESSVLFVATDSTSLATGFAHEDGLAPTSVEGPKQSDHCIEIGQLFSVDAPAGTLEIQFGPTTDGELTLIIESAAPR